MSIIFVTHDGVAPELGHLTSPHGGQQGLPNVQFEHVADHYLHGPPDNLAVVYHRALIVAQLGAEVERHLRADINVDVEKEEKK